MALKMPPSALITARTSANHTAAMMKATTRSAVTFNAAAIAISTSAGIAATKPTRPNPATCETMFSPQV